MASDRTLYRGGLVFDGLSAPGEGLGVLVEGDRIAAVEPVGNFDGFDGATVDTTGNTLMPGLMDCHIHIVYGAEGNPGDAAEKLTTSALTLKAMDNARMTLEGGVVAVRDCGGKDYVDLDVRDALNAGRFPGPVMRASGKMICMTGGHGNKNGIVADGCDEVIKAVRTNIHKGVDVIKIMATGGVMTPGVNPEDAHYSAEEMRAGVQEARRFHKRTASHAQGAEGIINAVRAGIHSIEHGIFMDEQCIKEMIDGGVFLVPTLAAVKNIINNKRTLGFRPGPSRNPYASMMCTSRPSRPSTMPAARSPWGPMRARPITGTARMRRNCSGWSRPAWSRWTR